MAYRDVILFLFSPMLRKLVMRFLMVSFVLCIFWMSFKDYYYHYSSSHREVEMDLISTTPGLSEEEREEAQIEKKDNRVRFSSKRDLPVSYLSDKDLSPARVQTLNQQARVMDQPLDGTALERVTSIRRKMEPFRLQDDYRFCVREIPMEGPFDFSPKSKNPCWYSNMGVLQCLPYFYIVGVSKSGTTDVFGRLFNHPQVKNNGDKEKHWLDFFRYYKDKDTASHYATYYNDFAQKVQSNIDNKGESNVIIGDATPCYFFFSFYWPCNEGNRGLTQPKYTNPHVLYRMNPKAKIIISMRDPVKRLFSRYMTLLGGRRASPEKFHQTASRAVEEYTACIKEWSPRHCAYNGTLYTIVQSRLQEGMYSIYLKDWMEVFPREQMFIFKFEDYTQDVAGYIKRLFEFLEVEPVSESKLQAIATAAKKNVLAKRHGSILPETEDVLQKFYRPFNAQLRQVLGDQSLTWGYD